MYRKKILITIDWFLPGTASGGPVRSYLNLIAHLNEGFEFYIITRNTDFGSDDPYKGITPNTWTVFNAYTKVYYISSNRLTGKHLKSIVNQTEFDMAYINGIYSWYFSVLPIRLFRQTHKPIIVSARGMLNPQAFSVKRTKKKVFLKFAKIIGLYRGITFHATNTDEANHIKGRIGANAKVVVAPNLPRMITQTEAFRLRSKHQPLRFVNIARVSVEKGTLTMLKGLKRIKEDLQLDIYGPIYDSAYWEKCQIIISELPEYIKVNYKGVIESDKVPDVLRDYDFFVMLSEGENFGHAILEGLSAGCPVIISDQTPWKNLESKMVGWDVNAKNTAEIEDVFEKALSMSDKDYAQWSEGAYDYASKIINNPEVLEQNKALFLNALNREKKLKKREKENK